ncbi:MAG: ABC transporter permease [Clostridia bacterium]|nr:ABC transporter permease [Clostridia bacterium]
MTVFKTFWKIVNRYKFTVILYTVILIIFATANMQTSDTNTNFVASKPDILIINNDKDEKITENLINYIKNNSNIVDIKKDDEAINDALFYRDVNYIIYIPENYGNDFLDGKNPEIKIKSTGDYNSSLAEMMLSRYVKVANIYLNQTKNEDELISKINDTLKENTKTEVTSKLNTDELSRAVFYYNFLNYSIIAGLVYIICLILSTFREEKIRKRTIISSMNYKKHNMQLLISNGILSVILWIFYVILSFVLIGDVMFTSHGLILIANSFVFSICALCIAFLIANIVSNKNAINGIVNVVGLGSSFLCGAFVPVEWLPDTVLKIAHILPSYWFIQNNEIVKTLEEVNMENLKPIFVNMFIVLAFSILYIIIANIISKKKRKIA